jgi:hypothetical protein
MSWFKKTIQTYEVDGAPLTEEDKKNPYINDIFEEEFVKIPIVQHPSVLPEVTAEVVENGSSSESPDVSS